MGLLPPSIMHKTKMMVWPRQGNWDGKEGKVSHFFLKIFFCGVKYM